jgi:thiosulfate dehydrogenase [quinone] large subunit
MSTVVPPLGKRRAANEAKVAREVAGGRVARALLLPLRIYLGTVFLLAAWPKLTADGGFQTRMEGFLRNVALESAHGFYRGFLEFLVLPNVAVFTPLVVFGELFVALALLAGFATRLAAGVAMFFLFNYMLAKGMWLWTPASNDAAMFFMALILMLGAAGRAFGVDRYLHDRYPAVGLW